MSWRVTFDNQSFRGDGGGYTGDGFVLGDLYYVLQNQGIRGGNQVAGTLAFGKFVASGLYQAACDVGLIPFAMNDIGEAHLPIFTRLLKAMGTVTAGLKALTPNEKVLHTKKIGKHVDLMEPMFRVVADMCRCPKSDRAMAEFASAVYMPDDTKSAAGSATSVSGWAAVDAEFKSLLEAKSPIYKWGAQVYVALNHIADRKEWKKQWDSRWVLVGNTIDKHATKEVAVHFKSMLTLLQQSYKGKDSYSFSPSRRGAWMVAMAILSNPAACGTVELKALDEDSELAVVESIISTLNTDKKAFSDRTLKIDDAAVCQFGTERGKGTNMLDKLVEKHGSVPEFKALTKEQKAVSTGALLKDWDPLKTPCLPAYLALSNRGVEERTGASADLFDVLTDMYVTLGHQKVAPEELPERFADKQWAETQCGQFSSRFGFDAKYFSLDRPRKPVITKEVVEVEDDEIDAAARVAEGPSKKKRKKTPASSSKSDMKDVKTPAGKTDGATRTPNGSAAAAAVPSAPAVVPAPARPRVFISPKPTPLTDTKKRKHEPEVYNYGELARWSELKCLTTEDTWRLQQWPMFVVPSEANGHKGTYVSPSEIVHGPFNCLDPLDSIELQNLNVAHTVHAGMIPEDRCKSTFLGLLKEAHQHHRIWVKHSANILTPGADWSIVQIHPTPKHPSFHSVVSHTSLKMYTLESCAESDRFPLVRGMLLSAISSLVYPPSYTEIRDFYVQDSKVYRGMFHGPMTPEERDGKTKENAGRSVLYSLFRSDPTHRESSIIAAEMKSHSAEFKVELDTLQTTITKWLVDRTLPPLSPFVETVFNTLRAFL